MDVVRARSSLSVEVDAWSVGLDPSRLARLDRFLDNAVAAGRQKGSFIAITRGDRIAHMSYRGQRDAEAGALVETDTIWHIYSMTKPITSVAAMVLYEEGALSLFDPVAKYVPAFGNARVYHQGSGATMVSAPASKPMLVWHLLTHTSGLTYDLYRTHPVDEMYRNAGFGIGSAQMSLEEACNRWAAIPLLFEPGTEWNYSVSTDVLGRVIEVASGLSLDKFFSERIFKPLGMSDTGFAMSASDTHRLARLYKSDPESGLAVLGTDFEREPTTLPRMLSGGAGLYSTASDYLRFTRMLARWGELDGVRLLAPRTVELMASNQLPGCALITPPFGRPLSGIGNEGRGFGLGFAPLVDPIAARSLSSKGEYSWSGAAGTTFWVDPIKDMTVLFCTQVLFARDDFNYHLRQLVYQALMD